ncbi:MAG TPA: S1 RNA-binding domain-containing protein [Anaerolineae bacterium]|nr:S1 RNA-binding domain-containing protein [Anaerolineae bacterium]
MNSMETRAGGQTAADETNDILAVTGAEARPQAATAPRQMAAPAGDETTIVFERGETGTTGPGVPASDMEALAVEDWDYQRPRRGEIRDGIILAIRDQEIIVDVGAKRDGIVPFADMQRMGPEALAELSPGDEVPVYIMRPEDQDGNLLVSLYMARQAQAWDVAQEMFESGEVWEAEVTGYNKGGVVVPVLDIRGFVPASQVPGFPPGLSQEERLQRLAEVVGEKLRVKIIEINQRKRRLILSATTAEKQWRKQQREQLLDELREGEVRKGHVSSLASFGAFVDLGGADGLIHISELAWRRVRHPKEVVRVGDEVEVYILRLDSERNRIGLSLKRLQPEPWALVEDKYELGQLVEGVVTNVIDFGAFAEIEEGIEGLIHVSELADAPVSHPRDVVKKGDLLLLRIIRIDVRRKRLGLSLKRVLESEWAAWAAKHAVVRQRAADEKAAAHPAEDDEPQAAGAPQAAEGKEVQSEPVGPAPAGKEEAPMGAVVTGEAEATLAGEEEAPTGTVVTGEAEATPAGEEEAPTGDVATSEAEETPAGTQEPDVLVAEEVPADAPEPVTVEA